MVGEQKCSNILHNTMVKIIPERRKTMYRLLRMLILLKVIPVSNNSFYTFKLWSVPTLMSCMIWFLPPTLFFAIAEWRAEIELSTVQEFKSENADLNRYVPVPVWQIQNNLMQICTEQTNRVLFPFLCTI